MKRFAILALALAATTFGVMSTSIVLTTPAFAQNSGHGGGGAGGGNGGGGGGEGGGNDLHLFFQRDRQLNVLPPNRPCTAGALCARAEPAIIDGCGADARPVRRHGRLFCESRRP